MRKFEFSKKTIFFRFFRFLIWDLFDFSWDVVVLPYMQPEYSSLRGPRPEPACIDGLTGHFGLFLAQKSCFFSNFSKISHDFFLNVSRPLRTVFKTFSEKNSKKIKEIKFVKKFRTTFFFSAIFRFFDQKKHIY